LDNILPGEIVELVRQFVYIRILFGNSMLLCHLDDCELAMPIERPSNQLTKIKYHSHTSEGLLLFPLFEIQYFAPTANYTEPSEMTVGN